MAEQPNADWTEFATAVPWFVEAGARVRVGPTKSNAWRPRDRRFGALFPTLTELLRRARLTRVQVAQFEGELFTWGRVGESRAWLCPPPGETDNLFAEHEVLLRSFGGIVERANEPDDGWLLNQTAVLTLAEASHDASFVADYAWAFGEAGVPIDLGSHYSIAREANGNTTLCERSTGRVLLFAPDHAFDHVRPLPGCPTYTLYELTGAPTFREWVERICKQWLDSI